ncbi:peptidoglycan-binding domain-containing protein [uncultured Bartonella sp.]|uniref:peptidoglycan-binding domain-containing protein n=1 Tax=uncultured Bartonella sp. TaxID=104108 RepID=UPI0026016710|nr:peptidoglycan-binding domain-containing protein [uncultured Bartonella sp.]
MVKQRKTPRNRTGKQRSFLQVIFYGLGRFIRWFAGWLYRYARKNPLLAGGFFLFFVGFGFVTFNALFFQRASHHAVFIQTRPLDGHSSPLASSSSMSLPDIGQHMPSSSSVVGKSNELPVTGQQKTAVLPDNLLEVQKKLASSGFYDGPLDGLDGPKTRSAIARWRESANNIGNHDKLTETQDDIAALISGEMAQKDALDGVTTQALTNSPTDDERERNSAAVAATNGASSDQAGAHQDHFKAGTADIMRVQAALRSFGDDHVIVTGKEDENTAESLRNFQKMFSLPVTGKINQEVIDKMKDIGLIG